jgi:hypothetical protein
MPVDGIMAYVQKMSPADMKHDYEFQAFVYDYPLRTQMIYIDGVLDASRASAGPYLGISGLVLLRSTIQCF